jgi:glycosyltransferase involved in cell wall biosynthesis
MKAPAGHAATSGRPALDELRVVFFSDAFRRRNGVGAYYCDLIEHLGPRIAAAELVCPGETNGGPQQGLGLPMPGDPSQRLCLPGILKARRLINEVRPHVVVCATPGPYGMLGSMLARRRKVPLCYAFHTKYDELAGLYWNRAFAGFAKQCMKWLDRRFFDRSEAVITIAEDMASTVEMMGARRARLLGTPIDPLFLTPEVPVGERALGSVMFVGRLAAEKNLEKLLDAARDLPDVPFVIAGDGPLVDLVKKAEAELANLDYVGWIEPETLRNLLDERCEILVLPSKVEAFGTVAAEAMARGRLALVSDRCGIIDWPELASGLEIFDADAPLAPKLRELTEMPEEQRCKMRARARARCLAFVERTVSDWRDTLFEVAAS